MDFINENVIKCLKQEIDAYRDKYAIALQEIKELNYFSKEDNDKLKAERDMFGKERDDNKKNVDILQAENKALKYQKERLDNSYCELRKEYNDNYQDLRKKNKELKADKMKHILGYDTLQAEYNSLKAENERLKKGFGHGVLVELEQVDELKAENDKLKADNVRLVEQVSSISGNSSSTHTHTIKKEIDDYMHHNPKCKGVRLFMLPRDEFNDGEYDNTIYWDDGME